LVEANPSFVRYIDVHLLASTALARDAWLWTIDKPLAAAATRLSLAHDSR